MIMRRQKPLPSYTVNGWTVDKRPNTFAESHAYEATAIDADGYQTARHGFSTLRAAQAFCKTNAAPRTRITT
jgi:hypothetical protein